MRHDGESKARVRRNRGAACRQCTETRACGPQEARGKSGDALRSKREGPVSRALFLRRIARRALLLQHHDDIHRGADAHGDVHGLRLVAGARNGDRVRAGIRDDAAQIGGEVAARAEVLVVDVDGGVLGRDLEPHARAVARWARKGLVANVDAIFGDTLARRRGHAAIAPSVVTRRGRALLEATRRRRGLVVRPGTARLRTVLREDAAQGSALRLGRELVERALAGLELQLLVDAHALAARDVEIRRERLIPRKAEFEVVLPGPEVEVVGRAVEVVGGPDVLAVEEDQRLFGRDVGLDDRVTVGARGHTHASIGASLSLAVIARHDVDARAAPPPRGVEGVPAPSPTVRVVTPTAAAEASAMPPPAVAATAERDASVACGVRAARATPTTSGATPTTSAVTSTASGVTSTTSASMPAALSGGAGGARDQEESRGERGSPL